MFDLDAIRSRIDVPTAAGRLGIEVPRRHNDDAVCPQHGGKSLRIKEDYFFCHGGCADAGGKGDIFALHMFVRGSTFLDAVEELAAWAGVQAQLTDDDRRKIERRRRVEDVLALAARFYAEQYQGSPAQVYAEARGIDQAEAQLGYAPDAWSSLTSWLLGQGLDLEQAAEAGVIGRKDGGGYYDVLRHRLVIPAYERGRCVYLQGRRLDSQGKAQSEQDYARKYKNVALGEPPLYHVNGALAGPTVVITESTTDVLALARHNVAAAGTYGASVKEGQRRRLERFSTIYVAAQNDDAGRAYADSAAAALGERVRIAPAPDGFKDWDEALRAGRPWLADQGLTWLRWRLRQLDPAADLVASPQVIEPLLEYVSRIDEPHVAAQYIEELARHFGWKRDLRRGYEIDIKRRRTALLTQQREERRVESDEDGAEVNLLPDVDFINAAQAYHNGVVYVSREMRRRISKEIGRGRSRHVEEYDVSEPAILTSDRRVITLPSLDPDAPPNAVIYLDDAKTLAVRSLPAQAARAWSYDSVRSHLDGSAPEVHPRHIYDALMRSARQYIYFKDQSDYVMLVLWVMGTYFHQLFDAFPYLVLNAHKGSGKTTTLHWLRQVAFNADHVVNTSEASLFRWIEAAAPTMLIDEQEGLNSRQAAKENKADLMGILKSGYQKGTVVTRQDMVDPRITRRFSVYCPKAVASVDQTEDILTDRSLIVRLTRAPDEIAGALRERAKMTEGEFSSIRDELYLLLMQRAGQVESISRQVRTSDKNRFGELTLPLLSMAALVDHSAGRRDVLDQLEASILSQRSRRSERDALTPESMLLEAVLVVAADAVPCVDPLPAEPAQRLADGRVVMDAQHIADAFRRLFPSSKESYFRADWLGKQVSKTDWIDNYAPPGHSAARGYRWRRTVQDRDPDTGELKDTVKHFTVYIVDHPEIRAAVVQHRRAA